MLFDSVVLIIGFVLSILVAPTRAETSIRLLIAVEGPDSFILRTLDEVVPIAERQFPNDDVRIHVSPVIVDRENVDASYDEVCSILFKGITLILDMTWTGWNKLKDLADEWGIVYERSDCSINPYVQAIDDLLSMKNATDVGLIFQNERELNQSLYHLIGNSIIRLVVIDDFTESTVTRIRNMRPSPSYYVIYANSSIMGTYFKRAIDGGLVKRDGIWNLVFTDNNHQQVINNLNDFRLNVTFTILTMNRQVCCRMLQTTDCNCPNDFEMFPRYFKRLIYLLMGIVNDVQISSGVSIDTKSGKCTDGNGSTWNTSTRDTFDKSLLTKLQNNDTFEYISEKSLITYKADFNVNVYNRGRITTVGNWTRINRITTAPTMSIVPARRYFRIGTAEAVPWSMPKLDEKGHAVLDDEGKEIWEGYCIDFIARLARDMNFDYDLVLPEDKSFGKRMPNGQWGGLVGDLAKGETDIVVAALTMTSEREEIIDFVAPYFEQSGILIVMRKPVRKTSLFKFMTVLRLEVWLSIVGALTLTGIMIWILDRYSPYSARNNKNLYPYPCREFTLRESFWFALTSFTPQGGGEAPKALSSRTLVAAYWLFVVLMLATFTANLAAFLTVERMQSPVQSLEQLARQSRINYTVLKDSNSHQYFKNMKHAEDKLYTVWKEITLNSTSDQVEYRVWDYPIKEQYGHILQAITAVEPVRTVDEGFKKVIDSEQAEFAFIHDSAEIKYAVTRNCNLTEVGEIFAEQPYAIAVQQGSHLQEEISRKILDLQKDRYFESLTSKYWNQSFKSQCPNSDDNEGITLESLGGVFIATLFGLALAMITLAGEILYYRKRRTEDDPTNEKQAWTGVKNSAHRSKDDKIMKNIINKLQLKPAPTDASFAKHLQPVRVAHISVYPRSNASYKKSFQ